MVCFSLFYFLYGTYYFFFLLGECESGAGKKISCHTVVRKCLLLLAQSRKVGSRGIKMKIWHLALCLHC